MHIYVFFFIKTHIAKLVLLIFVDFIINVLMCFIFHTQFFLLLQDNTINFMLEDSIVLLLFSKPFLIAVSFLRSLLGHLLAYLESKSPTTLHSYDEFPGPWIRKVSCNQFFGRSTYIFMCLTLLVLILEWFFDEAASPLI